MIDINTLVSAQSAVSATFRLGAYEGTAVAQMTQLLAPADLVTNQTTDVTMDELYRHIAENQEYHAIQKSLAVRDAGVVRHLFDLVKNTINPHICNVVKQINNDLECDVVGCRWEIVEFEPHALLTAPPLQRLLEKYKTAPLATGTTYGNGVYIANGDTLSSLIALTDEGGFNTIFTVVMDAHPGDVKALLNGKVAIGDLEGSPQILIAGLIALLNLKTPVAGTEVGLSVWTENRNRLVNHIAKTLIRLTNRVNQECQAGILYRGNRDTRSFNILVNKSVYRAMLAKGLTPDVVMGNEILGRVYMGGQLLEETVSTHCAKELKADFAAREAAAKLNAEVDRRKVIADVLRKDLERIATEDAWPVSGDSREKAWTRLRSAVDRVFANKQNHAESTEDLVAGILLATWYAHTDAWRVYQLATQCEQENPECETDEIMTLVRIRYLSAYLANQLTATPVTHEVYPDAYIRVETVDA